MIPNIEILNQEITERAYPNKTYQINFLTINIEESGVIGSATVGRLTLGKTESSQVNRIIGYVDDLESIKQAIYLILSTERYQYLIYSWDYGVELLDLIGKPMPYVIAEVPRRITEALTQDDRIKDVVDFEFEAKGNKLNVTFTVVSNSGNIPTRLGVDV
jgi:phage baseplate assembly protein W